MFDIFIVLLNKISHFFPQKSLNSIWNKVGSQLESTPPNSVDYSNLEKLFGQIVEKPKSSESIDNKLESKIKKDTVITFLDGKTSMNLNIILRALKLESEVIADIIRNQWVDKIDIDNLRSLLNVLPEKDEVIKFCIKIITCNALKMHNFNVKVLLYYFEQTKTFIYIDPVLIITG